MPPAVERLARKYLRSPAYISIGDPGAGKRAIEQRLEFLTEPRKRQVRLVLFAQRFLKARCSDFCFAEAARNLGIS